MSKENDAAAQLREYVGLEKTHVDQGDEVEPAEPFELDVDPGEKPGTDSQPSDADDPDAKAKSEPIQKDSLPDTQKGGRR